MVVLPEHLLRHGFNLIRCQSAFEAASHVRQNLLLSHLLVAIKVDTVAYCTEAAPNDVVELCAVPDLIKRQHLIVVNVQ